MLRDAICAGTPDVAGRRLRRLSAAALAAGMCLVSASAGARVIFREDFEGPSPGWRRLIHGDGKIEIVDGGVKGRCLRVVSRNQALAYYRRTLPVEQVRGRTLLIRCSVRLENVVRGPRVYSTAKIHVGWRAGGRTFNAARRFTGSSGWRDEFLTVSLPPNAEQVVLDLGIQNGTGTAWYDDLIIDDGVYPQRFLDISPIANTNFIDQEPGDGIGFLDAGFDLRALPAGGLLQPGGLPFRILSPARNFGRTCAVLRGKERPDLPKRIETVVPVKMKAARLYFLTAAAWCDVSSKRPCLVCTIHHDSGKEERMVFREGVNIGSLRNPSDLAGWKVVWRGRSGDGYVGLGVTSWKNPRPDDPVAWLRFSTPGDGAVPVVVAVSVEPQR